VEAASIHPGRGALMPAIRRVRTLRERLAAEGLIRTPTPGPLRR
jgi:hypothetical protein